MKVLVACEFSGIVREAFRSQGHKAYSCDLEETEIPGKHYKKDVIEILYDKWDLIIAHPPCTFLCNSGVHLLHKSKERWQKMEEAALFFKTILNAPAKRICVENPIMHRYAKEIIGRGQDQIIQPWQFGHPESKATCLWLKNLPLLQPTNIISKPEKLYWENQTPSGQNKLGPSKDRWKERSRTYIGIAEAFAKQYGGDNV